MSCHVLVKIGEFGFERLDAGQTGRELRRQTGVERSGSIKHGSLVTCCTRSESSGGSVTLKLVIALPDRWYSWRSICRSRTLRLHPFLITFWTYHSRASALGSRCIRMIW